jgi:hypothetical protein
MPAISFNNRNAIYWGSTQLSRVYCGASLLWSKQKVLPWNVSWTTAETPAPPSSDFSVTAGSFQKQTIGGQLGIVGAAAGVFRVASEGWGEQLEGASIAFSTYDTSHPQEHGSFDRSTALHTEVSGTNVCD